MSGGRGVVGMAIDGLPPAIGRCGGSDWDGREMERLRTRSTGSGARVRGGLALLVYTCGSLMYMSQFACIICL